MKDLDLIRKMAWSFHATTGIEFDELFSEASLAYCLAVRHLNENKGKRITYLAYSIRSHLTTFVGKEWRRPILIDVDVLSQTLGYYPPDPFNDFMKTLPEGDCKVIAEISLQIADDSENMVPKAVRGELVRQLRAKKWAWGRIWAAIRDLKAHLNDPRLSSILSNEEAPLLQESIYEYIPA